MPILKQLAALLLLLSVLMPACQDDESTILSCQETAYYRGTNVCHDGENAAAIELAEEGQYLIISNFFELVQEGTLQLGDTLFVEFEEVDFSDVSPALCGVAIVAPITTMSCVSGI